MGAESLLGMGDMLYMASGTGLPTRVHGAFVSDDEVHRVVSLPEGAGRARLHRGRAGRRHRRWRRRAVLDGEGGEAEQDPDVRPGRGNGAEEDRKASISYVQRKLRIGYNRSANLLEEMEHARAGQQPCPSSGQREVLVPNRDESDTAFCPCFVTSPCAVARPAGTCAVTLLHFLPWQDFCNACT